MIPSYNKQMKSYNTDKKRQHTVSFEVFMVVKIQNKFIWILTPCNVVVGYHCFRGSYCLHLQALHPQDGGSKVL
jgi:hypothetical protein